jgi:integrase
LVKKRGFAVSFHSLRHTHASLMLRQGVLVKVVSERLGHATASITLDVYSHVLPGMQREAVEKLETLLAAVAGE